MNVKEFAEHIVERAAGRKRFIIANAEPPGDAIVPSS